MVENHPQEALLISYADGLATPEESRQVLELVKHDQRAADFLQQLELTDSWLKDASEIEMGETPPGISQYVHQYELRNAPAAKSNQPTGYNRVAMAATLFVGLIGGGILGSSFQSNNSDNTHNQSASSFPEWVRLVSDYHRLYDRITVSAAQPQLANKVSAEVSQKLGRTVAVPDLTGLGMEFKRVQSLVYQDKLIVQMVYLPENSRPVAVCILAAKNVAESEVISGMHADMQFAYWQDKDHAVVVVGEIPEQQLNAVTQQVANNLFAAS